MSSKVINSICGCGTGGSARPNFSVHNYSEEKTTAGSTNEIQVYPVNTMNSWKIQDTEPSSPSLNDVWLKTGTGRYEFQPISGTNLTVPVSGASVWNGSSWDTKSTKCYYDGVWNPNIQRQQYYYYGTHYVNFSSSGTYAFVNNMHVGTTTSAGTDLIYSTASIDFTHLSELTFIAAYSGVIGTAGGSSAVGISSSKNSTNLYRFASIPASQASVTGTFKVDVSDAIGNYYITFFRYVPSSETIPSFRREFTVYGIYAD